MPLSISKLEELLASRGFITKTFFVMDGSVFYVEITTVDTGTDILLYMPGKYDFKVKPGGDVFKIKYIDMNTTKKEMKEIAEEYAGSETNEKAEDVYGGMDVNLSPDKNEKIEEHLENHYKKLILLDDISSADREVIKSIFRQVNRLKFCVQNIKYKIGIMYLNYICSIRRDDSVDCFSIHKYIGDTNKKLFVIVDLEMLYEKNDKIKTDVDTVTAQVYNILQRNQSMHASKITKFLESKDDISSYTNRVIQKNIKYDRYLAKLSNMLSSTSHEEKKILEELYDLEDRRKKGFVLNDTEFATKKSYYEEKLNRLGKLKEEILKNISVVRKKKEDNILSTDKIMFDNTVMFDCMMKNFSKLHELC